MEDKKIRKILGAVYELEGLLQMADSGKHGIPTIAPLANDKVAQIAEMLSELIETEVDASEPEDIGSAELPEEDRVESTETEHDDELFAEAAEFEQKEDALVFAPDEMPSFVPDEETVEESAVKPVETAVEEPTLPPVLPKFKFSINDKFRFLRELFGGSAADFKNSLKLIAGYTDLHQVEDYFYNDLQWNREDPVVEEFMNIISVNYPK